MKMNLNRAALLLAFALLLHGPSVLAQTKIMPLGDSITKGAVDPRPSQSGYRARLFDDLKKAGNNFQFIGCTDVNGGQELIDAKQQFHNGYGSYRIDDLFRNFDGVTQPGNADNNKGGYWMTGGNGTNREAVFPDIILLLAGTNDLGQGAPESVLESRLTSLLDWLKNNRPQAQVFVGTVPPRGPNKKDWEKYNAAVVTFNTWMANDVAARGGNFHLVDIYALFVDSSGKAKAPDSPDGIFLADGIHPSHQGYVAMGDAWFEAIKSLVQTGSDPASTASPAL
jgi:hypothetical protein